MTFSRTALLDAQLSQRRLYSVTHRHQQNAQCSSELSLTNVQILGTYTMRVRHGNRILRTAVNCNGGALDCTKYVPGFQGQLQPPMR